MSGNQQPSIDASEHIGPAEGENIAAKRVGLYVWNSDTEQWDRQTQPFTGSESVISNPTQYTLRMDEGDTYTYIGEAAPGVATSAASWRIKRMTNSDTTIVWADGDANFNNVWDNRASLGYS